ncbi:MAG: hypothetical protein M3Y91_14470 [Actinomycetota bacterium]|nr:hypothetical protein [Actinomycetota bacterium]
MIWVAGPGADSRQPDSTQHPAGSSRALARMAVEFGLPVAVYYALRAGSVDIFSALLIGAVVSAVIAAVPVIRHRHLEGTATYITAIMACGVAISLLAGSTQFLLARGALFTGITGLWFIASIWCRRPLAFLFSRPLLQGKFRWPEHWDELWDRSPPFRRMWRVSSLLWGIGTLIDSALRIVIAYTLAPNLVPALDTALYAATAGVVIAVTTTYYALAGIYNRTSALYPPLDRVQAAHPQ